jgi:DNA-binding transcriptional regulator YiaG
MQEPNRSDDLARARRALASGEGRRTREALGLSARDLAGDVAVHHTSLLRWEDGRVRPRADAALRYIAVLDRLRQRLPGSEAA